MITHLNPDWQVYVPFYGCYKFMPLNEALTATIQYNVIMIGALVRNNILLRDAYRDMGSKKFTKELVKLAHCNGGIADNMKIFNQRLAQAGGLSDYDIQVYSKDTPLTFFGVTIQGLQGLQQRVECSLNGKYGGTPYERTPEMSDIHIGRVWEGYPMFDSYDVSDNRTFDNYLIRNHPITQEEISAVAALLGPCNGNRVTEYIPANCLPLVYYEGEGESIYVASAKSNTP